MSIFHLLVEIDYGLLKAIKGIIPLIKEKSKGIIPLITGKKVKEVSICCPSHWGEMIYSGMFDFSILDHL